MTQSNQKQINISLVKKDFASFEHIDFISKSDRNFIIDCLDNGVDGRILQFVNSYIFFKSYPIDIENISSFFGKSTFPKKSNSACSLRFSPPYVWFI